MRIKSEDRYAIAGAQLGKGLIRSRCNFCDLGTQTPTDVKQQNKVDRLLIRCKSHDVLALAFIYNTEISL